MKTYTYSNEWETYKIFKMNNEWIVEDVESGLWADKRYSTLKEAKKAIDNQEIYF